MGSGSEHAGLGRNYCGVFIIASFSVPIPGAKPLVFSFGLAPEVEAAALGHPECPGPGAELHSHWRPWLCQLRAGCVGRRL